MIARMHQSLVWDRTRHLQRLRSALREYFPAALEALAAAKLELTDLDACPGPAPAGSSGVGLRQPASPAPRSGCWSGSSPSSRSRRWYWGRVLAGTRTLRSTPASPASVWSSEPGCSPSSETTHTAIATRKPAATTLLPRRSPAHPAADRGGLTRPRCVTGYGRVWLACCRFHRRRACVCMSPSSPARAEARSATIATYISASRLGTLMPGSSESDRQPRSTKPRAMSRRRRTHDAEAVIWAAGPACEEPLGGL
jgi:hypothetical protein